MSPRANLLPAAYELRYQRRRRLRRWVAAGVVVMALQLPALVVLRQLGTQARTLQQGLLEAERQREVLEGKLSALKAGQTEVDQQIRLADRLARKHRWSELFTGMSACLPPTAVLTKLESDPPQAGTSSTPVLRVRSNNTEAPGPESQAVAQGMVITGVAVDHETVAEFLRNLNGQRLAGRCSLESTMRQPYLSGEGVAFTIRTKW